MGLEIGILTSELEKLAVYAGESKRIERADVARMVGAGRVETVWKALDAATTGQARVALELLDNLLAAGEFPVMLLAAMSANLIKVHHAGRLRASRLPLDEACRIAGIPVFAVEKTGRQHCAPGSPSRRSAPRYPAPRRPRPEGGSSVEPARGARAAAREPLASQGRLNASPPYHTSWSGFSVRSAVGRPTTDRRLPSNRTFPVFFR